MTGTGPTAVRTLPVASTAQTRAALFAMVRAQRGLAVLTLVVLVAATVSGLAAAPLLGRIVDLVVVRADPAAFVTPTVLITAAAVAGGALTATGTGLLSRLGEGMLATLRERFVLRALELPLEQVEAAGSGDLTARVTEDVAVVSDAVNEAIPELGRAALGIGLTLLAMTALDWRFLLVVLIAVPIQAWAARRYVTQAIPLYARQRAAVAVQQQQLLDTVGGAATVRAFGLAATHLDRLTVRSLAAIDLVLRGIVLITRLFARLNLAEVIGLSGVLVAGFVLHGNGEVSLGTVTAAALYFHNLFGPVNTVLATVDEALAATASLSRLVGVADLVPPGAAGPGAAPADGSVEVVDLGHAYAAGHPVLHEVRLRIADGERVALVGASGAGKTTLAKLIAGVHRPSTGSVRLGGAPLADLDPALARRTVALVTQEVHVFAGSLVDDLRLAAPDADLDRLRAALGTVGALDWADALPDGLDTTIGEGAHRLRTTQAQQLALARLLLADPPIVILDEATAEAGSAGARVLEAAAEATLAGRTGLVVAHRLTQAAAADRVVVLDEGRVVESGTHDELLACGGRYAALWSAWRDHRSRP